MASTATYCVAEKQDSRIRGHWTPRQTAFHAARLCFYYTDNLSNGPTYWKRKIKVASMSFEAERYTAPDYRDDTFHEQRLYVVHLYGVERPLTRLQLDENHTAADDDAVAVLGEREPASGDVGRVPRSAGGYDDAVQCADAPRGVKRHCWTFRTKDYDTLVNYFAPIRGRLIECGKMESNLHRLPAHDPRNGLRLAPLPLHVKGCLREFGEAVFYFLHRGSALNGVRLRASETDRLDASGGANPRPSPSNSTALKRFANRTTGLANAVTQALQTTRHRLQDRQRRLVVLWQLCYLVVTHDHILCVQHERKKAKSLTAIRVIALSDVESVVYSAYRGAAAADAAQTTMPQVEPFMMVTPRQHGAAPLIFTPLPDWIPACWHAPPHGLDESRFCPGTAIAKLRDCLYRLFEELHTSSHGQLDIPSFIDVGAEGDAIREGAGAESLPGGTPSGSSEVFLAFPPVGSVAAQLRRSENISPGSDGRILTAIQYLREVGLLKTIHWSSPVYGVDTVTAKSAENVNTRHTVALEHKPALAEWLFTRDADIGGRLVGAHRYVVTGDTSLDAALPQRLAASTSGDPQLRGTPAATAGNVDEEILRHRDHLDSLQSTAACPSQVGGATSCTSRVGDSPVVVIDAVDSAGEAAAHSWSVATEGACGEETCTDGDEVFTDSDSFDGSDGEHTAPQTERTSSAESFSDGEFGSSLPPSRDADDFSSLTLSGTAAFSDVDDSLSSSDDTGDLPLSRCA